MKRYGDLGKRLVAYIIDAVLISVVASFIGYMIYLAPYLWVVGIVTLPFLSVIYFVVMEGGSWHATLGKRAMNLYVADENGLGISYSTAILRYIGKILSGMILGIGYIMCFFNNEKQCLHDMIAKTYVCEGKMEGRYTGGPLLVCVSGPLAGMTYHIGSDGLVIGRDSVSCNVVLPASQGKVSRIHCYITYNPMSGMYVLNDRNSTHGTFLANGTRVTYAQPAALMSGSRFYLATPDNSFEVR